MPAVICKNAVKIELLFVRGVTEALSHLVKAVYNFNIIIAVILYTG